MSELSLSYAVHLGKVIDAVLDRRKVRYLDGDGTQSIRTGTLRGFVRGASDFNFFKTGDGDIRDAYIWITDTFEHTMPVRFAVDLLIDGEMAFE